VQRLLGHSDPKITERRYGHLLPDFMAAEVNRLRFGLDRLAPKNLGTPLVQPPDSRNTEAGTASVSRGIPASELAGCRGLEPLASGVTVHVSGRARSRHRSQLLGNARKSAAALGTISVPKAHFRRRLGTPLVRNAEVEIGRVIPLTVRQVASALRVNPATIYHGVAKGSIRCIRGGHALRIPVRPTR